MVNKAPFRDDCAAAENGFVAAKNCFVGGRMKKQLKYPAAVPARGPTHPQLNMIIILWWWRHAGQRVRHFSFPWADGGQGWTIL
jgi:hypothetical protein